MGKRPLIQKGDILFSHVAFSYGKKAIFQNLCLHIPGGTALFICGGSGMGKSTLVKLIMGLLKPEKGHIQIDGQPLKNLRLDDYYRYIAYIPQESPVFEGSLRENLLFDQTAEEDRIYLALRRMLLDEKCRAIGLEGEIGEKGALLSGGERQRLALARLYFTQAQIIILDEATSALDTTTEAKVLTNLLEDFKGKTILLISHRENTGHFADGMLQVGGGYAKLIC